MKIRTAFLLGLVLVMGAGPGCRGRKVRGPVSPWLEVDRQPPEEGAIGILTGPGRGQQEFSVAWVKARQPESIPGLEFLDWFRGPRLEKVMAVECLSLSSPLVSGEPSEHPAVFAQEGNRALIWGGPSGWGWVDLKANRARVDSLEAQLATILETCAGACQNRTNADGWTLHNRLMLVLSTQTVRTEPRDDAPAAPAAFPDGRLEGEGLWRTPGPKEFSSGSNAKPHSLEDLDVEREPKEVREVVARPLERRGDWIQVAFPEPLTPTFLVDASGLGESAENQALLVKWSAQPAGWVRLYARGPAQGTKVRLWSWHYYGSHD
jgi:hypothetical protein